jgi:lantibiotic biosynthesis protein
MTWTPLLAGHLALAARAWEAIDTIVADVHRLSAADTEWPASRVMNAPLLLAYLAHARNGGDADAAWSTVETELTGAMDDAQSLAARPRLYGGLAGLGWVVEHIGGLAQEGGEQADDQEEDHEEDQDDVLAAVDAALLDRLRRESWDGVYDLIGGLTGLGVYFLERWPRPSAAEGLGLILDQLERCASATPQGLAWFTPPTMLPEWQREIAPDGYYNLGVAHGAPGVLALLSDLVNAGVEASRTERMLDEGMRWLLAQSHPEDEGPRFDSWIAVGQPRRSGSRQAWCYGDLGILGVLDRIARDRANAAWQAFVSEMLESCLRRSGQSRGTIDAPLCHGAIGIAHVFNRLAHTRHDTRCSQAALRWITLGLDMRRPGTGVGGFWAVHGGSNGLPPEELAKPDFLDGATGIALALLSAVTPVEPAWDRLLLLSGRGGSAGPATAG